VPEAGELAAAVRGSRTFVGLQGRSAPPLRYLADLVGDGYVACPVNASGETWGPLFSASEEYMLDRGNGATMLTIPFAHTLDALTMVLGELGDVTATMAVRRPLVRHVETGRLRG
jgi:predicted dehydrogenase